MIRKNRFKKIAKVDSKNNDLMFDIPLRSAIKSDIFEHLDSNII